MKRNKRNYWTKEKCKEEAEKYTLRSKFKVGSGGAYNASIKNGWLDYVCLHMSISGNKFKRLVYVYEFDDRTVYVGLTYNIEERDNKHKRDIRSPVFRYIKKNKTNPILSFSEYVDVNEAVKLEAVKIKYYKDEGYNVLNIASAGAVGGNLKWTKEKCKEEALKSTSRKDFYKKNNSAYNSARNNNWLDEVCSHMPILNRLPKGYWTKERCMSEALMYSSKKDLHDNSVGAYMSMVRNGWLNELCPHMKTKKPNRYWTKEKCKEEAAKYKTLQQFKRDSRSAYLSSFKCGWLSEICLYMKLNFANNESAVSGWSMES
jgi:predicted GIY-YIG superfamily endonuclease